MRLDDETRHANEIDVAIDAAGNAIAVWQSSSADQPAAPDLRARRFSPGAGWSSIEAVELLPGSNTSPRIAMTATGTATVAWLQPGTGILATQLAQNSVWGAPVRISSTEGGVYETPAVAAGGLDSAVVA